MAVGDCLKFWQTPRKYLNCFSIYFIVACSKMNKCGINTKMLLQLFEYCGIRTDKNVIRYCVWWMDGCMWLNWSHDNFVKCNSVWNVQSCREWQFKYIFCKLLLARFYLLCNDYLLERFSHSLLLFSFWKYLAVC